MNQSKPAELFELLAGALGGSVAIIVLSVAASAIFILWAMWMIFPVIMYYQLRAVQIRLAQLHGDLVEVNLRLRDALSKHEN